MAKQGKILIQASEATHALCLSSRDIHLLDGFYFFRDGWTYRKLLGLDFIRGLKSLALDVPLLSHSRVLLSLQLRTLLLEFETQKDLISFDYFYGFGDEKGRAYGGGGSGFRIDGGHGSIDLRPAGYCDLTISDIGPNGRGRVVAIIDLRVRRRFETLDRGLLKVYTRKAAVGWFEELPKLIAFLDRQPDETVEILHKVEV